jgi:hypothetical protein
VVGEVEAEVAGGFAGDDSALVISIHCLNLTLTANYAVLSINIIVDETIS